MRSVFATILLLASCGTSPPTDAALAGNSALNLAYGTVRDARVCAALDPRTELRAFWAQVEQTENLLFEGWQAGLGGELSSAKQLWEEIDAYSDKICPFQMQDPPTTPSLKLFAEANDALEAAIAAEAN